MQKLFVSSIALACFCSGAFGADAIAFVAKTSNASTLAFVSAQLGSQTSALPLGLTTQTEAVYSANGRYAYLLPNVNGTFKTVTGIDLKTHKRIGSATVPIAYVQTAVPTSDPRKLYLLAGRSNPSGAIYSVDLISGQVNEVFNISGFPATLALSPDGSTLYLSTLDKVTLIGTNQFQVIASYLVSGVFRILPSPDGERLYLSQSNGPVNQVVVFDLNTTSVLGTFPADSSAYVALSPDGSTAYTTVGAVSGTEVLEQVSASSFSVIDTLALGPPANGSYEAPLSISPDGSKLALGYGAVAPSVTLVALPALKQTSATPVGNVCGVYFKPSDLVIATNCGANTVGIVDIATGSVKAEFDAGPSPQAVLSNGSGSVLYSANQYGVWALATHTGKPINKIEFPARFVSPQLALSADGKSLFASYGSGIMTISTITNQATGTVAGIPAGVAEGRTT